MKALILAAGLGARMRPLTDDRQKTLLPIAGRAIIDRILDGLREQGIVDIHIVTGYRAEELRTHLLATHSDLSFHFIHNERYDKTNNIYSMALAFESIHFDSDLILIESDLIYEPAVLGRLMRSPHENVALVDHYRPGMDGTVVAINEEDVITQVIPSSLQSDSFEFGDKFKTLNIYRFSKEFCQTTFRRLLTFYANAIDDNCYYELVLGMLIYMQQAKIHAEVLDNEMWSEVDDPNDIRLAEYRFNATTRSEALQGTFGGYWGIDVLDFAFIRNMYFPPPAMLSELRFHLPELLWNYGSKQSIVDTKMSWALGCSAQHLHALAGSSQCYPWLRDWFTDRRWLLPRPTFGEYARVTVHADYYADAPGIDWSEIESRARQADLIVFVNPNNPTGTTLGTQRIADFAKANPTKTVLVDESFVDFSGERPMLRLLEEDPLDNVIVLKSLSKCLGVPGVRLGLVYTTNDALGRWIDNQIPIWNVNSVAENFLEAMLKHREALEQSFFRTIDDRRELASSLSRLPLVDHVFPSGGNFLLTRLTTSTADAAAAARRLVERDGIFVKDVSTRFDDDFGYWRIAVRSPGDHVRLCTTIESLTSVKEGW